MIAESTPLNVDSLVRCVRSAIAAKLLLTALEADLFTWLASPRSLAETAERFGWQEAATAKFCEILSYLGLVTLRDGVVRNSKETDELLRRDSRGNIAAYILESCKWCLAPLDDLPRVLREGPVPPEKGMGEESLWEDIIACGANMVFADSGRKVAGILASLPGSENFRRMLDLGGGHGGYALCAAEAMPGLDVDVLDFPAVLRVAERFREGSPAACRVHPLPGDYVTGGIPCGYDLVLASETLNFTLPGKTTQHVMDKIYAALNLGGYCVSVHDGPAGKGLVPEWPFECHVCDLVTGSPMAIPGGFLADAMLSSGFSHVRTEHVRLNGSVMTADIGRK